MSETFPPQWFLCRIAQVDESDAPDFSKVPAHKREDVERRWRERQLSQFETWRLWGPQIPMYQARGDTRVEVIGPVTSEVSP